ncbi:poly(A) polymerase [Streptomyces sp. AP-93]|uniref:poly(A) polymerase n=1 Tax=Streptomyces sp. AP-93 TaxID=2929048 RepID=UPI001FAF5D91|nr:poly(A) polymerase [Streptomyces sp. AP-93]MCJ0874528.1 RNA repair domain-containing protein [Streptomyces sp. AP-93]
MRTSEELYHQVRWDPRFDPARFTMGLLQRGAAPKRIPLPSFVPGGDIPWHRVLFVEADGELVWDRATGVDIIDGTAAGRVRDPRLLRAPFFTARTPYAWDASGGGAWRAAPEGGTRALKPSRVRLLTWNTLWDRYDAPRIATARRRPLLLADLAAADADVIALQEVERELLGMLLAEPWVRDGYTVAADPRGRDVAESGLLVLSRLPVREAGVHVLGPHKAVVAVTVDTAGGPLVVAATHLTSDHTERGADRRTAELTRLSEGLSAIEAADVALLGDFNDGRSGAGGPAAVLGLRDVWTEVHGAQDGTPTFDPVANPLAAVGSLSGRAARLDRILLRSAGVRVARAALRGDSAPADGLFISDHYGVEATLDFDPAADGGEGAEGSGRHAVLDVQATGRTAVAWLTPRDEAVEAVRRAHDPQAERWPAHVNLLFGFVPESSFEAALPLLAEAAAESAAFTARLEGVYAFGPTLWLDPAAAGDAPWQELRRTLAARFPGCRGRAEGFTPHLTLGRSPDPRRAEREFAARLGGGRSARVGSLAVLSRRGDGPMEVRATVELGTGRIDWAPEAARPASARPGGAEPAEAGGTSYTDTMAGAGAEAGTTTGAKAGAKAGTDADADAEADAGDKAKGKGKAGAGAGASASASAGAGAKAGAGAGASAGAGAKAGDDASARAEFLVARIAAALPEGTVHVVGSRRMGCALPDADLDLVVALPGAVALAEVRARVASAVPEAERLREVTGARVPGLRLRVAGLDVDLVVVATGPVAPDRAVARRAELGEAAAVALSAVSDADAVRAFVGPEHAAFARLAREVKAWARSRGLDSAPFGGLPGLAWSVLAAHTVRSAPGLSPGPLLRAFFATWAAWDWRTPVSLAPAADPSAAGSGEDAVTVLTPSAPVRSCTTQVGAGTADLLTRELFAAWEALEESPSAQFAVAAPAPAHRRHAAWAVVTVTGSRPGDFEDNLGRMRGRLRALLGALAETGLVDAHAWPRPFERTPARARYAIGLGHTPPDASALAALAAPWSATLPGTEVTWADCGTVPTLP